MGSMGRLQDKVAIVTGAGSGIGRATAMRFAQEGARVVIAEIQPDAGKASAEAIAAEGGEALFVATDVTRESDVAALAAAAVDAHPLQNWHRKSLTCTFDEFCFSWTFSKFK